VTSEEFEELVSSVRRDHPVWFGLESDAAARDEEISAAEADLQVSLPLEYRQFVKRFGGGYFALANVFSVTDGSDWSIVLRNRRSASVTGKGFVAVSDNGTGDYYGFCVHGGACERRVSIYDHSSGDIVPTEFDDLFDFLARKALAPA
jgi:hypothetical protein